MMRRFLSFLGIYLALSVLAAFLMLLPSFPYHPTSLGGWFVFLAIALPLTIVGEGIGRLLLRNPIARRIDAKTKDRSFSWLRVSFALVTLLLFIGLFASVLYWLGLLRNGPLAP